MVLASAAFSCLIFSLRFLPFFPLRFLPSRAMPSGADRERRQGQNSVTLQVGDRAIATGQPRDRLPRVAIGASRSRTAPLCSPRDTQAKTAGNRFWANPGEGKGRPNCDRPLRFRAGSAVPLVRTDGRFGKRLTPGDRPRPTGQGAAYFGSRTTALRPRTLQPGLPVLGAGFPGQLPGCRFRKRPNSSDRFQRFP